MIGLEFFHGLVPGTRFRFTEKQLQSYEKYGESAIIRTRCLSGVCIAMKTSSKILEIELAIKGKPRNYLGLDLEVDGRIVKSIRMENLLPEMKQIKIELFQFSDEKEREIRLYLPVSVEVEVLSFSAKGKPVKKEKPRILFLGDSITQGMSCISPVCSYPVVVAKILNANFINQGVGGHIFDPDTLDESLPFVPDIITVAYGVNDWAKDFSSSQISQSVHSYLEKLKKIFSKSKIFVITPIWTDREQEKKQAGLLDDVREIIKNAAIKTGCNIVDGLSLVPHSNFYFADGVHPNEAGHLIYGVRLASYLTKIE